MSSEVQSRPAASRGGRGASRGGRGGFGGRNSTRPRDRANGDAKAEDSLATVEDEGEIGELKKLYGAKTSLIKEMFPDWSDVDILFALRETDGDENLTVTRIAEGTISQWDEVSKSKKDRAKTKANSAAVSEPAPARSARSGGGAGPDKTRGRSSARTTDRGGRSSRGRSAQPTNGTHRHEKHAPLSVPTEESYSWDNQPAPAEDEQDDSSPAVTASSGPKTWASMLRQVTAPPPKRAPVSKPKEASPTSKPTLDSTEDLPSPTTPETPVPDVPAESEPAVEDELAKPAVPEVVVPAVPVPEVALAPSTDQLTESNLEHVVDISHPPDTDTNRSEATDSWDPRSSAALAGSSTPFSASQHQHQQLDSAPKPLGSGYATTASKATDQAALRIPNHGRRILDQKEAVRMPGNRDVDRAALQFGALSFNGAVEDDVDGAREDAETRAQLPDDSPAAPRTSLPPAAPAALPDAFAGQKPATASAAVAAPSAPSASAPGATIASAPQQPAAAANQTQTPSGQQFGRYNQTFSQDNAYGQKFDTYGAPATNAQYDGFQSLPAASQAPQQPAGAAPTTTAAPYSSAPGDYSQYLTSDAQSRAYSNYYNQPFAHQAMQSQQDGAQNQRYGSYPMGDSLNQYPQSNSSRFGSTAVAATAAEAQNSGNSTPNPPATAQQHQPPQATGQVGQGQHAQPQQAQQAQQPPQQHGGQYQHPYYSSPYYSQYMPYASYNNYGQGNFTSAPYSKGGYNGGHHPYGMSQQAPYDGFGNASALHRGADNSGLGSGGLGDYGRAGANQALGQQAGFGGGHDNAFARGGGAGGYQAGQAYGGQQAAGQQASGDDLKPFGESKGATGPTPSLARPGSATNPQATQAGLPPTQANQQAGYSGYQSHLQGHGGLQGNQSIAGGGYGMGGGASQNHGNNPYSQYGGHGAHNNHGGQGFGSYYGNPQRGWGNNY